jgi:hypothetical protein
MLVYGISLFMALTVYFLNKDTSGNNKTATKILFAGFTENGMGLMAPHLS